jgi:hypothetical protein
MLLVSTAIVVVCVTAAIGDSRVSIDTGLMLLTVALFATPSQAFR